MTLEHKEGFGRFPKVVVVDMVICTSKGDVVAALWIEFDTANVGLAFNRTNRSLVSRGPNFDFGVITSAGQSGWISPREINAPCPFLVLIIVESVKSCLRVPQGYNAFIVRAGNL